MAMTLPSSLVERRPKGGEGPHQQRISRPMRMPMVSDTAERRPSAGGCAQGQVQQEDGVATDEAKAPH